MIIRFHVEHLLMRLQIRLGLAISGALVASLFLCTPFSLHAQTPSNTFQATYFAGRTLQGAPLLTRLEPVVNWTYDEGGSPAPGVVPTTDFSARWEGWYSIDRAGKWTFTFTSDDGGRVWLDNDLVMDMWYDHAPLTRAISRELTTGFHLLRVEYFQHTGGMTSQLTITPPGVFPDWMGEYFDNPYLLGEPRLRVNNVDINFNWGASSPDPRLASDNFSVRWTRIYNFAAGNYTFIATADDGIRVWVGDTLAIDGWVPQQARTYSKTLYLDGTYPLRVEYFEQGGEAVVNFAFQAANASASSAANENWHGQFFNNVNLTGPALCEQNNSSIRFDWGTNSPGCGIAGQFFSARWESTPRTPATGFYTVYLTVDDGARVFVDDKLILDAWREQPPTNYSTTLYLNAGLHNWRVDYFQAVGSAQISLQVVAGVMPRATTLPPSNELVVDALGAGWTQGGNGTAWRAASNGYGGSALVTSNNAFIQPLYNWGRWYPPLTQARNYQVLVYIPEKLATTNNARYWIFHNGQFDAVALAQAAYNNAWVSLGTFFFNAQGGEFVSLSDVTYEPFGATTLVYDAVKFVPQ